MVKPRVTATDNLSNVIEVVGMGRRTGLLSVERGTGPVVELGEIYFAAGRPIYAVYASLRGNEAFAALSRWGACRFAFDGDVPQPTPNILPTNPSLSAHAPNPAPLSGTLQPQRDALQNRPTPAVPNPPSRVPEGSGVWALPPGREGYPQAGNSGVRYDRPTPTPPAYSGNLSNPNMSNPNLNRPNPSQTFPASPAVSSSAQTPLAHMPHSLTPAATQVNARQLNRHPRRAPDVRDLMKVVTTHNLSRNHRTMLLLADGEHTILDLARLSSKPVEEIISLLADLESRGLVYYYAAE